MFDSQMGKPHDIEMGILRGVPRVKEASIHIEPD